ncbi:MAG: hypothetical protein DI626_09135 [Micavibrio aeruginosavorus]|uniref:EF-hand domain-containing protein n=1 Tax=Micavibrio aeruginosavorus TaxID=349221 RepID=A0A2W4ZM00_9BACT|nr:MAG: hypothetical protein DI626_09135 [Micavibrio aeruginosavorus]
MDQTVQKLKSFFENLDSKNNWQIDADEAVRITLQNAIHLTPDTVGEYSSNILQILEGVAYERMSENSRFSWSSKMENEFFDILRTSDEILNVYGYINLADKTEMTLPDGSIVAINRHNK